MALARNLVCPVSLKLWERLLLAICASFPGLKVDGNLWEALSWRSACSTWSDQIDGGHFSHPICIKYQVVDPKKGPCKELWLRGPFVSCFEPARQCFPSSWKWDVRKLREKMISWIRRFAPKFHGGAGESEVVYFEGSGLTILTDSYRYKSYIDR